MAYKGYKPRLIDVRLRQQLESFGAVLLLGPKWCGKTTTAQTIAQSAIYLQDPDHRQEYLATAEIEISRLLRGENPRLLDEWQDIPALWDAVRFSVDRRQETGLYILTGSTNIDFSKVSHSGTGRIARVVMRTMSLFESGYSSGEVSLSDLFAGKPIDGSSQNTLEETAEMILRGGWPSTLSSPLETAIRQVQGYCEGLIETDINTVDGVKRDPQRVREILRAYARHTATPASNETITKDVAQYFDSFSRNTVSEYLAALESLFALEPLPAWTPALRSRVRLSTSPIRHFTDPAMSAYFLDAGPANLTNDLPTMGLLFESMAIRDLRVYAEALGGKVFHYRDHSGLEADAIVHLHDGRWGAIEVKMGAARIDDAAENLQRLVQKIDTEKMHPRPSSR